MGKLFAVGAQVDYNGDQNPTKVTIILTLTTNQSVPSCTKSYLSDVWDILNRMADNHRQSCPETPSTQNHSDLEKTPPSTRTDLSDDCSISLARYSLIAREGSQSESIRATKPWLSLKTSGIIGNLGLKRGIITALLRHFAISSSLSTEEESETSEIIKAPGFPKLIMQILARFDT
jgi:hypothetical protein